MKRLMQRAGAFLFIPALCGTAATLSTSAAEAAEGRARVLVLDIELVDTSHEGEHPAHADRLDMVSRHLRALLDEPGTLEILGPVGGGERIRACNGCEVEIARKAGADFVLTGYVHKVSTLILSVTLTVKDVATGRIVAGGSADIRGDNDRSWLRGVGWLVEHRLLAPHGP